MKFFLSKLFVKQILKLKRWNMLLAYCLLLIAHCLLSIINCNAQDTIIQRNGFRIAAKVLEIDKQDVKYKKFENPEGPSYVISKSDVSIIRYQNGSADTLNVVSASPALKYVSKPTSEMYLKGQKDAETFYTKYKPAGHWALGL